MRKSRPSADESSLVNDFERGATAKTENNQKYSDISVAKTQKRKQCLLVALFLLAALNHLRHSTMI